MTQLICGFRDRDVGSGGASGLSISSHVLVFGVLLGFDPIGHGIMDIIR